VIIRPCTPTVNSISNSTFGVGNVYVDTNNICWTAINSGVETDYNNSNDYVIFDDTCSACVEINTGVCSQIPNPECKCIEVIVIKLDLDDATGNTINPSNNNTVFLDIWECDNNQSVTLSFTVEGTYYICGILLTPDPYYYKNNVVTIGGSTSIQSLNNCTN
jgi:hypothetical protein